MQNPPGIKKFPKIILIIFIALSLVSIFYFFNHKKDASRSNLNTKTVGIADLKKFTETLNLPKNDPTIKRVTKIEKNYSINAAVLANTDNPISVSANGAKITLTSVSNQNLGGINDSSVDVGNDQKITYRNIYNGIDIIYTPSANGILEEYEVKTKREISYLLQKISISDATYKKQNDGSILFYNSSGDFAFAIPKPVMYEKYNTKNRNYDLHYEIFAQKGVTYLAKVIDQKGKDWLNKSNYPVEIDATVLLTLSSFHSFATVDSKWQIQAETVGSGDFKISPSQNTSWSISSDPSKDLNLLSLTCSGNNVAYQNQNDGSILVPNFSCDGTIVITIKVKDDKKQNSLDFEYSGFKTTVSSIVSNGKPVIISSSVNPGVVKIGDTINIKVEAADDSGIKSVIADMGGVETVNLSLSSGNSNHGIWQGSWVVHNTATKPYEVLITASNGKETNNASIGFFDPYTCTGGGDHAGADWNPATDCPGGFAGTHTNIGTASISNGQTATVTTFNGTSFGSATISASTVSIVGTVTATGKGYSGGSCAVNGSGPGGGSAGWPGAGGGGYGGAGGTASGGFAGGSKYGTLTAPVDLGSGGGGNSFSSGSCQGGNGGGAIQIIASGTLTVSGSITANGNSGGSGGGANNGGGGGSGGSIYLTADTFAGSGTISANGGSASNGGGGGGAGRLAFYYSTSNTFNGTITTTGATSGNGGGTGGTGTNFIENSTNHDLLIPAANGTWSVNERNSWSLRDLTFNANITLSSSNANLLTITTTGTTTIASGVTVSLAGSNTSNSDGVGVYLNLAGDLTIPQTSSITATGLGYSGGAESSNGSGPGRGLAGFPGAGGAGYGGAGGSAGGAGGAQNGSLTAPVDLGSGGGGNTFNNGHGVGGAGGGAIRLTVAGTLTISGSITSSGNAGASGGSANNGGGGGAGGSIYITTATLAGSGSMSAVGGNASNGGGTGGGGRIAAYYSSGNNFSGTLSVAAGTGGSGGGLTGTGFIENSVNHDILIPSANGIWNGSDRSDWNLHDLTINASITFKPSNATLLTITTTGTTTIASGVTITVQSSYTTNSNGVGVYFNLAGNLTLPSTSSFTANSLGYAGGAESTNGSGPGPGLASFPGASGGGYGGAGGNSSGGAAGGSTYGSSTSPVDLGSGGGGNTFNNGHGVGGAGGGAIKVSVAGTFTISGSLTSNGANGASGGSSNNGGGGGSGGSIFVTVGTLQGTGSLTVNGGSTSNGGGGGGGGRISISCQSGGNWSGTSLTAAVSAVGGSISNGGNSGSNGTVSLSGCTPTNTRIKGTTHINGSVRIK